MSYSQEEKRPIPTVEVSQKYMAWNIKEMSESLKIIAMALKNIDSNISKMMQGRCQPQQRPQQPKAAQDFSDEMAPF
jgi:NADH:ubiquinone oxidoreductase subunit D